MTSDRKAERREDRNNRNTERGLAEWAHLNGLTERLNGNGWSGQHLLGKQPRQHWGRPGTWWDHPHGFGVGRQRVAILAFPYVKPERVEVSLSAYAQPLGLPYAVGDPEGPLSIYFWGSATPWLLAAPGYNPAAMLAVTSPLLVECLDEARQYAAWRNGEVPA